MSIFFSLHILAVKHYNRAIYLTVMIQYQATMLKINLKELSNSTTMSTWLKAQEIVAAESVELQDVNEDKASGLISGSGSERYHTEITCASDKLLKMRCDCRAFEFHKTCKHGYALAIAASGDTSIISEDVLKTVAAKRQRAHKRHSKDQAEQSLLIGHLQTQEKTTLEASLLKLINADKVLKKTWLLKAEFAAQSGDPKVLKKRITQVLPLKHLFEWQQVAIYFDNADTEMVEILSAAQNLDTENRFEIIMTVYKRLAKVFERVDDSGGFRFELIAKLDEHLEQAFTALDWSNKKKALWLKKYSHPPFDVFADVMSFQCYQDFV
tara:strand:+ start:2257 stop:3231 length:975 start_codon:yes stop_codon:yes gene_type:complete